MLIDPFTVVAQIVNFVILVIALKYFLYDRVIDAMDRREASIAARLHDADQREAAAAAEAADYRRQREALEDRQREIIERTRAEASDHRHQLLEEARAEVDDERHRWERALRAEQRELRHDLERGTAQAVVELTRRTLSDLAASDLEEVVVGLALDRLETDREACADLFGAGAPRAPVTVRTAFEVPRDQRTQIFDRLRSMGLGPDRGVLFEEDADLILGVELQSGGTAVSWHADDYLDRLRMTVHQLIGETGSDGDGR